MVSKQLLGKWIPQHPVFRRQWDLLVINESSTVPPAACSQPDPVPAVDRKRTGNNQGPKPTRSWELHRSRDAGRQDGTPIHLHVWEPSHFHQGAHERCAGRNVEAITLRAVFWAIPKETSDPVFMKPIALGPNEAIKQRVLCVWSKCGNFYKNIAEW